MKNWKKRWEEELDNVIPALSDEVKNAPIPAITSKKSAPEKRKTGFVEWFYKYKKRFFAGLAACAAVLVACIAILPNLFPTPTVPEATPAAVLLEINPKAVFSVDKEGKIEAVVAENSDADVILAEETRRTEILEKTAEEGIQVFVDYAVRLGYLDLDPESETAVRITAYGNEQILGKVETKIQTYFCKKGAYIAVVKESVSRELFCERAGLETAEDIETLTEMLRTRNPLYSERVAEDKKENELQDLYGELVPSQELRELIVFMKFLGMDTTGLEALLELPQTLDEYRKKLDEYLRQSYESLTKKYEEAYNRVREEIDSSDYEARMRQIEDEYGSLGAYWDSLKK